MGVRVHGASRVLPVVFAVSVTIGLAPPAVAQVAAPLDRPAEQETLATVSGVVTSVYVDDVAHRRSGVVHLIRDERTGQTYQLRFEHGAPPGVRSGRRARVTGRISGRGTFGPELVIAACCDSAATTSGTVTQSGTALPSGDQRTLVIGANFTDASLSCSDAAIDDAVFADPSGLSVDALYRSSSLGLVSFSGQVVGPYQLSAATTDACDISGWADALDAKAAAAGIDTASYPRKVYVMPPNTCPGAGLGTIGDVASSRAWIFACGTKGVYAHELGHNLGMDHASTPLEEYGDGTDPMTIASWMLPGVNAPHRLALGWLAAADAPVATQSGVYDIAPLAIDPALATAPRTILIAKPDTQEYYYLSYRLPLGFDNYIDGSYYYRLSVHRYTSGGTVGRTFLLAGLADGEQFVDTVNGITITQLGHDSTHATAQIDFTSACAQSTPSVSVSPQAQSATAGSAVTYTLSITDVDSAACPATAFSVSAAVPGGWTAGVSPASVTLVPGGVAQVVATVTSAAAAAAGTYTAGFSAASTLNAGAIGSATGTYTVQPPPDTSAPTAPSGLTATANQKRKQIALGWTASSDNVGVAGYRVFRNGALAGTSSTTSWTDSSWTTGATYTYAVVAYDAAGNVSTSSNSVTLTLSGGGKK